MLLEILKNTPVSLTFSAGVLPISLLIRRRVRVLVLVAMVNIRRNPIFSYCFDLLAGELIGLRHQFQP